MSDEKPTCTTCYGYLGFPNDCEVCNPQTVIATPKEPTCEHDNVGAHWNWAARNGREVDYCNGPVMLAEKERAE